MGQEGSHYKLGEIWMWKGFVGFFLLGIALQDPITLFIGCFLVKAADIYFEEPDRVHIAEYRIGDLYGRLMLVPFCVAAIKTIWGV